MAAEPLQERELGRNGGSRMAATTAVAERYKRQINKQESTEVEAAWEQR